MTASRAVLDACRRRVRDATIFIVPYCHADWAWTYTRQWHEERYTEAIERTLELMRVHPELTSYIDTWNEQLEPVLRRRPELLPELRRRVMEERITIAGGTICNPHSDRIGGESYVRNLVLGRRRFLELLPGADLTVLAFNDVAFGHAQTPQLARLAGYSRYRAYRPQHALNVKGVPTIFRWRGLDGTELVTARGHYGILYRPGDIPADLDKGWEQVQERFYGGGVLDQVGPGQPPVLWVGYGSDDALPLSDIEDGPVNLPGFIEAWNRRESSRMRFGTPHDVFRAIEPWRNDLPVHDGVVDPIGWSYWFGQLGNRSLRTLRVIADDEVARAELWATAASDYGHPYPAAGIEGLWLRLLKTSPHAVLWLFTDDYEDLLREVYAVRLSARRLLLRSARALAPRRGRWNRRGIRIRSDLAWDRREWVSVHYAIPVRGKRMLRVRGLDDRPLPAYAENLRLYEDGTIKEVDLRVRARLAGAGIFHARVEETEEPRRPRSGNGLDAVCATDAATTEWGRRREFPRPLGASPVELGDHEIRFRRGRPASLRLRRGNGSIELRGAVFHPSFHEIEDTGPYHFGPVINVYRPESTAAERVDPYGVEWSGRLGPHQFHQRIDLTPGEPLVRVATEIESCGGDGFFRLGVPLPFRPRLWADNPWGMEPRDLDAEPRQGEERLRRGSYWAWSVTTADDPDSDDAISLFGPVGVHGAFFEPRGRRLGHVLLKVIGRQREGWERFATRLREGKGVHRYVTWLWAHRRRSSWATVLRKGRELRSPAAARAGTWIDPATGETPGDLSVLRIEGAGAIVTAYHRDDAERVLRLFDATGRGCAARVHVDPPPRSVRKTDLNGGECDRGEPVVLDDDGVITVPLAPWEIATVRFR